MEGIKVSVRKTKVLCSRNNAANAKITSVKFPCGVCWEGVRANSILCLRCKKWVHKSCLSIRESLRNCKDFICKTCWTIAEADHPFPICITIETVIEFCYLGDIIGQAGGSNDIVAVCIWSTWKVFHELLCILTNRGISWKIVENPMTLLLSVFDLRGRLFMNFYLYSQTEVYHGKSWKNVWSQCHKSVSVW